MSSFPLAGCLRGGDLLLDRDEDRDRDRERELEISRLRPPCGLLGGRRRGLEEFTGLRAGDLSAGLRLSSGERRAGLGFGERRAGLGLGERLSLDMDLERDLDLDRLPPGRRRGAGEADDFEDGERAFD